LAIAGLGFFIAVLAGRCATVPLFFPASGPGFVCVRAGGRLALRRGVFLHFLNFGERPAGGFVGVRTFVG